jgi:hypothetical protein
MARARVELPWLPAAFQVYAWLTRVSFTRPLQAVALLAGILLGTTAVPARAEDSTPSPAPADDPDVPTGLPASLGQESYPLMFAHAGTWVLWADQSFLWGNGTALTAARLSSDAGVRYAFSARMALDRFVTDWMSVGLVAGAGLGYTTFASGQTTTTRSALGGLALGFAVPLGNGSVF